MDKNYDMVNGEKSLAEIDEFLIAMNQNYLPLEIEHKLDQTGDCVLKSSINLTIVQPW